MERVKFSELQAEFKRVLLGASFPPQRAELCARIFAENMRDGIYSHGLLRFPDFVHRARQADRFDVHAEPTVVGRFGPLEQWDGGLGPGPVAATYCMGRSIELASSHTIGCVALRRTNHWMRAGTYALQAAAAGYLGICWTNTTKLMPPWGARDRRLGNNPLAVGIPRQEDHVLLDMAMTQFSGGKTILYSRSGTPFPEPGGYDEDGQLTRDAAAVSASGRPLPIGYWKGSGLALVLDMVATILSGGSATVDLSNQESEYGVSQVFIAVDIHRIAGMERVNQVVDEILDDLALAEPVDPDGEVTFPGERMLRTRRENMEKGIPVDAEYWGKILSMPGPEVP